MLDESEPWNESFCGCCSDMGICCYGFWCPACLFGSNSSKINGTSCIMMCCIYMALMNSGLSWIPHYFMREKLRRVHGLEEDRLCTDIPATFCYAQCALCQEAREMKSRGHFKVIRPNSVRKTPPTTQL